MIGVYGANGFIGTHLVRRLATLGKPVRAVSRRIGPELAAMQSADVDLVEADLADQFAISASLDEVDMVVQAIGSSTPAIGNHHILTDITENVIPHVEFLASCAAKGVRRFVFLSSGGTVYGIPEMLPIPEHHPTRPITSYGVTKLTVERYAELFAATQSFEAAILRISNPYGPGQLFRKGQGLIPATLERHHRGLPVRIFGDGSAVRDYVYIDDVIDAILAVLDAPIPTDPVLNIGSGGGHSITQVVDALQTALGEQIAREFIPARGTDVPANILDISKAHETIGWRPEIGLADGLTRMLMLQ